MNGKTDKRAQIARPQHPGPDHRHLVESLYENVVENGNSHLGGPGLCAVSALILHIVPVLLTYMPLVRRSCDFIYVWLSIID